MAILTGINSRLSGSIGEFNFRQRGGKTVVTQKVAANSSAKRTMAVMQRRVIWANIVNLWKSFAGTLKPSFEGKAQGTSDFNAFMSANLGIGPVYLTKSVARSNGAVVAPVQITRGSLPAIVHTMGAANRPVTDIALGAQTIDAATTLKQFSQAVVANNDSFQNGDQISCYVVAQHQNAETGIPFVTVKAYEVTLNVYDNDTLLASVVPATAFGSVDGHIGTSLDIDGAIAWVHSRKTAGGVKVSSQHLMVRNTLLAQYQSDEALAAAVSSYGGAKDEPFLAPNTDGQPSANAPDAPNHGDTSNQQPGTSTQFTLSVTASPAAGGTVTGGGSYSQGAAATLTATPASGYTFTRWSDGITQATRTVTVTEDKTLTALFTANAGSGGGTEEG